MNILVLGGTAWLGGHIVATALARGHSVTCLARGASGQVPEGAVLVQRDRDLPDAYDTAAGTQWDAVVDLARQPAHVRNAAMALAGCCQSFVYVSTVSVYADNRVPGQDEDADKREALAEDVMRGPETYGPAKMACETYVAGAFPAGRTLIVRPGLIGGPGDVTDRTGYWPLRFARPSRADGCVVVPDTTGCSMQIIDVRDLAAWIVVVIEGRLSGCFNAVGDSLPLAEHLATARRVAGHTGPTAVLPGASMAGFGVAAWSGETSFPLWLPPEGYAGFGARMGGRARAAGLVCRRLEETVADTLDWELSLPAKRERKAGLSDEAEVLLLDRLAAAG